MIIMLHYDLFKTKFFVSSTMLMMVLFGSCLQCRADQCNKIPDFNDIRFCIPNSYFPRFTKNSFTNISRLILLVRSEDLPVTLAPISGKPRFQIPTILSNDTKNIRDQSYYQKEISGQTPYVVGRYRVYSIQVGSLYVAPYGNGPEFITCTQGSSKEFPGVCDVTEALTLEDPTHPGVQYQFSLTYTFLPYDLERLPEIDTRLKKRLQMLVVTY